MTTEKASFIDKVRVVRLMEDYVPKTEDGVTENVLGGHFYIPKYQRGYRWTGLQVQQLLDDLLEFDYDEKKQNFYCLQPLVVQKEGEKWVVVDGQQRLTTIFIIIKCLRCIADSQKRKPIYTLEYESKPELWECLNSLGKEDSLEVDTSDIDKYYITNAYKTVHNWVKSKAPGAESEDFALNFAVKIRNGACFIWYEVNNGQDAETTFTNINMGKILLTNGELIKALLLKKDNFSSAEDYRGDQARISMDWDQKEISMHKSAFWLFLTNDSEEKRDVRIEMVFDIMARRIMKENGHQGELPDLREKNPNTYLFLIFSHKLDEMVSEEKNRVKRAGEPYRYTVVLNKFWLKINSFYQMFQDWYEEKEWYHLVGYWIKASEIDNAKVDLNQILYDLSDMYYEKSKSAFTEELKRKILSNLMGSKNYSDDQLDKLTYKELRDNFSTLHYGGTPADVAKIKKILLLFNVITMQTNKEVDSKFPFHYYKKTNWNLEHIHSATTSEPRREKDRVAWLEAVNRFLKDADYISDTLKTRISSFKDYKDDAMFERLYEDVSDSFSGGKLEKDVYRDGLPNMTLLDERINKSYQNDIFPMKRDCIMDKMGTENFVPICTKNIFLKYYTRNNRQNFLWDEDDRKWYYLKMCLAIYNYLTDSKTDIEDAVVMEWPTEEGGAQ